MQIRHRIAAIVLTAIVACFAIGAYAVFESRRNANRVRVVTDDIVPSAMASSDLVSNLKDVQLATINLVTANDVGLARQLKSSLDAQRAMLQAAILFQEKHADSDTQRGIVVQAKESLQNYFASVDDVVKLKLDGQNDLAKASVAATVAQYRSELEQIVEALRVEKRRSKDAAIADLKGQLATAVSTLLAVSCAALGLLSVLGTLLYRQIIKPIGNMQSLMTEIAVSQDYTRRVPVDRADEIGRSIEAFNTMIARIEESSLLVREKSADIQAILQNMPQGILTIVEGKLIHPEYSAYLTKILETNEIAGRDLMTTVFGNTTLSENELSQIDASLQSCLGEDAMNFDFNSHLLPGEITKTMADGRVKILDLNWSPITDDSNTIVRLMLCVRDITELRKLAAKAVAQKRELEMVGEILAITQEKFHEFTVSALKLVDESEIVLRRYSDFDAEAVAELFRNLHTIKGNARTFGLRQLTDEAHRAEQTYAELRKSKPMIAWDQDALLAELFKVRAVIERYAQVNEVSLGRRGPGRRGGVERYLMVDKAEIQAILQRLDTVNTANLHELIAVRDAASKTLRLLGTEHLADIIAPVIDSAPNLAAELGKASPQFEINDHGNVIRNQASGLIKNVFVHLIRNSIDHGIESAEERISAGKPAEGRIRVEIAVSEHRLKLILSDDGRGLALAKIRAKAQEQGLISAEEEISDQAVADLIFRAGFSTAETLSDISGRGVGLDAVRAFLKREGGEIALELKDPVAGSGFRAFLTIISLPESFAVQIDSHKPDSHTGLIRDAQIA